MQPKNLWELSVLIVYKVVLEDARELLLRRHMVMVPSRPNEKLSWPSQAQLHRKRRKLKQKENASSNAQNSQSDSADDEFAQFQEMRKEQKKLERSQAFFATYATIAVFILFWFGGAAIFSATEDWNYFEGVYFS